MKTAMEELIEEIKSNQVAAQMFFINDHINFFDKYLEKEKQQLIKAHIDGFDHIVVDFKKQEYAEQYYNQTYNQNK